MGTRYHIKYYGTESTQTQLTLDSLLQVIDRDLFSTYSDSSYISMLNKQGILRLDQVEKDLIFINHIKDMLALHSQTHGAFDPTIGPIVNYWGFGPNNRKNAQYDTAAIRSLLQLTGIDKLSIVSSKPEEYTMKLAKGAFLDFSASAKGLAADMVCQFLYQKGAKNRYVEIGGELCTGGDSPQGGKWTIGINTPSIDSKITDIFRKIQVTNKCVASSGNYRNYYLHNDKLISHTINPKSGLPSQSDMLSATIIGDEGGHTDAYATACMTLSSIECIEMMKNITNYEAYILYTSEDGSIQERYTSGMTAYLLTKEGEK